MRNIWYPQGKAQYMTTSQLKTMTDVVIERDTAFGTEEVQEKQPDYTADIQVKLLQVRGFWFVGG